MNKKYTSLLGLVAVLVVMIGAYFLIPEKKEESQVQSEIHQIINIDSSKIEHIQYVDEDESLQVYKTVEKIEPSNEDTDEKSDEEKEESSVENSDKSNGDSSEEKSEDTATEEIVTWICKDLNEKINQQPITSSVNSLSTLVADRLVAENAEDLAQYGLDNPSKKIIITMEDGSTTELLIGDEILSEGNFYVKLSSDNNIYMLTGTKIDGFFVKKSAVRNIVLPSSSLLEPQVNKIDISGSNGNNILMKKESEKWYVYSPYENTVLADNSTIEALISSIVSMKATDVMEIKSEQMEEYKLNEPASKVKIADLNNQYELTFSEGIDGKVYLMINGENKVYTLNEYNAPDIPDSAFNIIVKNPLYFNATDTSKITINQNDGSQDIWELSTTKTTEGTGQEAKEVVTTTYKLNGEEKEEDYFKVFAGFLGDLEIKSQLESVPETSEEVVSLIIEGEEKVEARFYDYGYNNDFYVLELNGNKVFLMEKKLVDDAIGAIR